MLVSHRTDHADKSQKRRAQPLAASSDRSCAFDANSGARSQTLNRRSLGVRLPRLFASSKPSPASQLKTLIVDIGNGRSRAEHKLAERLFRLLPELRDL